MAVRGGEPGPFFRLCDGRWLTKEIFVARIRYALSVLGYDSTSYAGHSFRIGAAMAAAERGIEDSIIKILGRWESSAYQLHVRVHLSNSQVGVQKIGRSGSSCSVVNLVNQVLQLYVTLLLFIHG